MPFRSVSFWSIGVASFLFAAALTEPRAHATMTVTPVRADGTVLKNRVSNGATFYFPMNVTTSSTLFLDSSDPTVPPSILSSAYTARQSEAATTTANAIFFKISSDKSLSAGGGLLAVTVKAAGSNNANYVPITLFSSGGGLASCVGTNNCYFQQVIQGTTNAAVDQVGNVYYYGVPFTSGSSVIVGLYPNDICNSYNETAGGNATGCTTSSPFTPTVTGTTSPMQLTFNIETLPNATGAPASGTAALESPLTTTIVFENTGPTASCPSFTDIYRPGDKTIFLNTTAFNPTYSNSSGVPLTNLVVVAKDSAAPTLSSSYTASGANDVIQRVPVGATDEPVTGFTNTSSTLTDHNYQVGFMPRDAAGLVAVPPSSCILGNGSVGVQTAAINGFLQSGTGCFIATAAYRDVNAAPVRMLREFRDRVLLLHSWGRSFTEWYYGWSPPAAGWLLDHPAFRYPVLLALVPLEIIAWGTLHPIVPAALMLLLLLGFFALQVTRRGSA